MKLFKITIYLLTIICLGNVFAAAINPEKINLRTNEILVNQFSDYKCGDSEHQDCDNENCSFHLCHMGHCVFPLSKVQIFHTVLTSILNSHTIYFGNSIVGFKSSLIEPPTV